jgi:membrane protein DedA with SNARE-associated domain
MSSLEEIIVQYGYLALFIGTFLEGETILLIAGYLAHQEYLELPFVILFAFLGTFAGDQLFFYFGRAKGIGFLEKRPKWKARAEKVFKMMFRYQVAVILGFRFLYGIRNVTPFVIGASGLRPFRFFVLNFIGAATWAVVFGVSGYELGGVVETVLDDVKKYQMIGLAVIGLIALLYFLRSNFFKK